MALFLHMAPSVGQGQKFLYGFRQRQSFTRVIVYHRVSLRDTHLKMQKQESWPSNFGNSGRAEHHSTGVEYFLYLSSSFKQHAILLGRYWQLNHFCFARFVFCTSNPMHESSLRRFLFLSLFLLLIFPSSATQRLYNLD